MEPIPEEARPTTDHWDDVYRTRHTDALSWFQAEPTVSLELIGSTGVGPDATIIDIGGGASTLVDHLVTEGYHDVTVLDVSGAALEVARNRLGRRADDLGWIATDVLAWRPERRYGLWHDRAVFHFLTRDSQRRDYRKVMASALARRGFVVMATFAEDGPQQCSGLPTARYSPTELAAILAPEFEMITSRREEHTTPAGVIQPFTWVVFRSTTD